MQNYAVLQISILTSSYSAFLLCVWVFFSQGAQSVFLPTSILLPLKGQSNREKSPSAFQDSKDSKQLDPSRLLLIFLLNKSTILHNQKTEMRTLTAGLQILVENYASN